MNNIVYSKKNFNVYKMSNNQFIVHNINKDFKHGHTHVNNFNTAKYIVNMAYHKSFPEKRISKWLLESIIRVSENKAYINILRELQK